MSNLPVAAFIATELVERQFRPTPSDASPTPLAGRAGRASWRTRAALAELLGRAADRIAPRGYRVAH